MKSTEPRVKQERDKSNWPIIVGGCYRSGTSLLRRMLDCHSHIHCGPEVKFFRDFYGYYKLDPLSHARFFTTVRHLGVEEDILLKSFGAALIETHEIAAQNQGKSRWADKNPENVLYMGQWDALLNGRFIFVHCVRNPLDTLASLQEIGFPLTLPERFEDKVEVYRTFVESGLKFEDKYRSNSFRMRYEDLVIDPKQWLSELMTFADEKYERGMLDFNSMEHQTGLEDPKISATSHIHKEGLGRGRKDLTQNQVEFVINNCKDLFLRLGYE